MKAIQIFIVSLLLTISASAQFKSASLTAAGLTCAMCTKAINIALEKLPFVESVKPDIKSSSFDIRFKSDKAVNFDAMKTAVEEAGFSVSKLAVKTDFNNVAVKNDAHVQIGGKTFHFLKVSSSILNGEKSLVIVDKNFLNSREYKKYLTSTSMECVKTGKAATCCTHSGIASGSRIYHVTI